MKKRLIFLIQFGFIILFLGGCSTQFIYQHPVAKPLESPGIVLAYKMIEDQRVDREIDKIYENKQPLQDIAKVMEEEIKSTGIIEKVLLIPEDQIDNENFLKENNVSLLATPILKDFKWWVPNYDTKLAIISVVSFCTIGVGGLVYGCFPTDVNGDTVLKMSVKDLKLGILLIDKEYAGHFTERKIILNSDTLTTRATVAGKSLEAIMAEFKTDLTEAVKLRHVKKPAR
jgi:hypothetical protein